MRAGFLTQSDLRVYAPNQYIVLPLIKLTTLEIIYLMAK